MDERGIRGKGRDGEKGQALILFALAAMGLLATLSLVVDAGNLYLTRRKLQNVADTAALVGAQRWNGDMNNPAILCPQATQDARQYAIKNGITTDPGANQGLWNPDSQNGVRVDCPALTGPNAGKADHIELQVAKQVDSMFAGIMGFGKLQVTARAVARSRQQSLEVATLSLKPSTSCNDPSTEVAGSVATIIQGNSYSVGVTCANGNAVLNITDRAYSYGGFNSKDAGNIVADDGLVGSPYSDPPPLLYDPRFPVPTLPTTNGTSYNDPLGFLHFTPGNFSKIAVSASEKAVFDAGVYHVTGASGISINGGARNVVASPNGPVIFVLEDGSGFSSQGNGTDPIDLYSGPVYNNIIIYSYDDSINCVKIVGGTNVSFTGTVYCPAGKIRIAGGSTPAVRGQVIGWELDFSGSSGVAVSYDKDHAADIPGPALVE